MRTTKVFQSGNSQAVRIPKEFQFMSEEVEIFKRNHDVIKSHHSKKSLFLLDELTGLIPCLPMPTQAAKHYGEIRSKLEKQGKPIGANDLWIAAHALALELTIVTNNVKEFSCVPTLELENWVD